MSGNGSRKLSGNSGLLPFEMSYSRIKEALAEIMTSGKTKYRSQPSERIQKAVCQRGERRIPSEYAQEIE